MVIQRFFVNPFQEASYVVRQAQGMKAGECLIIDCGAYYPEEEAAISKYIETSGLRPIAHLLTHAHLDHLFGARFVFETWGLRPIVDDADESLFSNVEQQAQMFGLPLMREPLREHLTMVALPPFVKVIHTPGHTQGSVCYLLSDAEEGAEVLFSGDTLFQSGVGRTDLPGGNYGQLMQSLSRLMTLHPRTKVLPGHGGQTTIEQEKDDNPYL